MAMPRVDYDTIAHLTTSRSAITLSIANCSRSFA